MVGMSPIVVASPPAEVAALTAILADPAKSAEALRKIIEGQDDLSRKIRDLDAREQALLKGQKTHAARTADLDSKEQALAAAAKSLAKQLERFVAEVGT
jgi:hypothetical protein